MSYTIYPFTKNRYFPHKRLRSADFLRDQEFADHKLAFLTHWVFGEGAVTGLGVQRIDADSLLVSPGFAVDAMGRYLIVDEPAICRIRTLKGFDSLTGETAMLWLTYEEKQTDLMFVPGNEAEDTQYAAAIERFSFTLTNQQPIPSDSVDRFLFSDTVLYEDNELRIRQLIPQILPDSRPVCFQLVLERFSPTSMELELHYAPILPGFTLADGSGRPVLEKKLKLTKRETVLSMEVVLTTAAQIVPIALTEDGFQLKRNGVQLRTRCSFQENLSIISEDPMQALRRKLLSHSPRELWPEGDAPGVPIAFLRIVHGDESTWLEDVYSLVPDQSVSAPYLEERLRRCQSFFPLKKESPDEPQPPLPPVPEPPRPEERKTMTTGVVTLYSGLHLHDGNLLYSEEIVHGLGPGTVFVEFGLESSYPVANRDQNSTDLLLGDASLFFPAGIAQAVFDRGIRVHPDKGTFELALRFKDRPRQSTFRLRWFAWRAEEKKQPKETSILLRLEPDIVRVEPGTVIGFAPVFSTSCKEPCDFWVPDRQSGLVTPDGLYTAPEKAGLYQVCAQVQGKPESKVAAFIIVKANRNEEPHESGTV